jgi:hypothetical protein
MRDNRGAQDKFLNSQANLSIAFVRPSYKIPRLFCPISVSSFSSPSVRNFHSFAFAMAESGEITHPTIKGELRVRETKFLEILTNFLRWLVPRD